LNIELVVARLFPLKNPLGMGNQLREYVFFLLADGEYLGEYVVLVGICSWKSMSIY
jgi:hypothetical protein